MSNYDRAAQFAPFAALTGYEEAIKAAEVSFNAKQSQPSRTSFASISFAPSVHAGQVQ